MKSKTKRLVHGFGINDADYTIKIQETVGYINGKQKQVVVWRCPFYRCWADMLKRAKSDRFKSTNACYSSVSVCEEWKYFSNFKAWMETQDWEGKQLDKDLFSDLSGLKKVYSPQTCCFISRKMNAFLSTLTKKSGSDLPVGVVWEPRGSKYVAKITNSENKTTYLGSYSTREQASLAWYRVKRLIADKLIEEENPPEHIQQAALAKLDSLIYKESL